MQQIYGAKVSILTRGGLADTLVKQEIPYSDARAELPEVIRNHVAML